MNLIDYVKSYARALKYGKTFQYEPGLLPPSPASYKDLIGKNKKPVKEYQYEPGLLPPSSDPLPQASAPPSKVPPSLRPTKPTRLVISGLPSSRFPDETVPTGFESDGVRHSDMLSAVSSGSPVNVVYPDGSKFPLGHPGIGAKGDGDAGKSVGTAHRFLLNSLFHAAAHPELREVADRDAETQTHINAALQTHDPKHLIDAIDRAESLGLDPTHAHFLRQHFAS